MSDLNTLRYWRFELDGAWPDPVRCPNCTRKFHPASLTRDGLCERCDSIARDDQSRTLAEAGRTP